jgi:hypothetical protein
MNKKVISAVAAVGIAFGGLVGVAPVQAEDEPAASPTPTPTPTATQEPAPTFTPDSYPRSWWSQCPQNGGDGVITWRTNSRALRVPMVKKVFDDLSVQMPNFTFKQVSWWNKRADITVGFSTRLKVSGWAWLRGRSYSKVGDIRRVVTRQPFRSYNDTVVEYILRHELWHAMGVRHQTSYGIGLMNPYWNMYKAGLYEQGLIPTAGDYAYAKHVNDHCLINQPSAYQSAKKKVFKDGDVLKMRGGPTPKIKPKAKLKRLP